MNLSELKDRIFIGVVEDNNDPKKLGRCRCRVLNIFDEIPVEDIPWATPWKDLNGNQFIVPDKGKVVSIVFDEGNVYKPEFIYAEHYNINLEKKLAELSGANYTSMRALMFDHKTQIYSNDAEGLKMDYKFNNINIREDSINLNLKDNFSKVNIGSAISDQQAILGNHFLNWFDKFINILASNSHLGNLAAPLVPTPGFLNIVEEYYSLRDPKFLSHHVNIVDNDYVSQQERIAEGQIGDNWKSTVTNNSLVGSEGVDYKPKDGLSTDTPTPTNGDLTTSSNQSGATNLNNIASNPGPINPSNHPDLIAILETMKSKGYVILTRPYEMNIVGIRRQYEGTAYSNIFKDDMYLIFKKDTSDKWEIKKYKISTMPGYYQTTEGGKSIDIKSSTTMQSRGGMGILKPAQYINVYQMGIHCGAEAMTTLGPQKAYRDKSKGNIIKYTSENEGYFGMFIHKGYLGGTVVNNWSEGCQIFCTATELEDFFKWCKMHRDKYGNKFNHTLMEERDVQAVKARLEAQAAERAAAEATARTSAAAEVPLDELSPEEQIRQITSTFGTASTQPTTAQQNSPPIPQDAANNNMQQYGNAQPPPPPNNP